MTNPVRLIIEPRQKDLGGGFRVRRVLPFHAHKMVGPFIFFDHFGPVDYPPGSGFDVRPHPHIGLSTVTYLFEGAIQHKDSLGNDLTIRPGAVNWMTAGRGIVHSERTPASERETGQRLHGLQTWLALPQQQEDIAPDFVHHPADSLPAFEVHGVHLQLLAGTAWGQASPVSFPWPILYIGFQAPDGGPLHLPADLAEERAIYIAKGEARISDQHIREGTMAILSEGADVEINLRPTTQGVICGGGKMDGPRKIDWNFVSSSPDKIIAARSEWTKATQQGGTETFPQVPGDFDEWIPLPD